MIRAFLASWRSGFYRRCSHRSHLLRLPCWRGMTYDGLCGKHNASCYNRCP